MQMNCFESSTNLTHRYSPNNIRLFRSLLHIHHLRNFSIQLEIIERANWLFSGLMG